MREFHPTAWLVWAAASATAVLALDTPVAACASVCTLVVVGRRFAVPEAAGRAYALFLKIGLLFVAVRVVLFGLTGHAGPTTLFSLPTLALPNWLGGFSIGGRVTGEVLAHSAVEGLRMAAALLAVGVFLSVVEVYRIIRLLPRFLFEAGLVVCIALTFVPALLGSAVRIRDAQRLRGHRFRGARSFRPLVVPLLAGALERSLTLAASMEARGYGKSRRTDQRREAAWRAVVLAGVLALAAAGGLLVAGRRGAAGIVGAAGLVILSAGLRAVGRAVVRTRYRAERLDRWDGAFVAASLAGLVLALGVAAFPDAAWSAYPALVSPDPSLLVVAAGAVPLVPVPIAATRRVRLARASARQPAVASAEARS